MATRRRGPRGGERGFTLLEIMVVLVIIALIASTVGVMVFNKYVEAQKKTASLQVRDLVQQVEHFMIVKGRCPSVDDLVKEGLLRKEPRDPWGGAIVIRCPGEHEHEPVDVSSTGPDQKPGSEDDIQSWKL